MSAAPRGVAARWLACGLLLPAGCASRHASDASARLAAPPMDAGTDASVHRDASRDVFVATSRFAPRWACRVTGPGRVGRGPHVTVPLALHGMPRGAIRDAVPLADGARSIAREPIVVDGGVVTTRARVVIRGGADAGHAIASREMDVPDDALELLFEDSRGAGLALLQGDELSVELVGPGAGARHVIAHGVGDVTRACTGPVRDAMRLYPIAARPWPFPRVTGTPPLVANARWVISTDARGLCIARLEGEGPWGRAALEADADGTLHGELSLSESLNPVVCAPAAVATP